MFYLKSKLLFLGLFVLVILSLIFYFSQPEGVYSESDSKAFFGSEHPQVLLSAADSSYCYWTPKSSYGQDVTANCSSGRKVIGGACSVANPGRDNTIFYSGPNSDGSGWRCEFHPNHGDAPREGTAKAYCCDVDGYYGSP